MKKELVENFISALMDHIETAASEAAADRSNCDSCFGMAGWASKDKLEQSIIKLFKEIDYKK